ncbi:MAG: Lar family restriction alleviation protein [Mogibacterium sp.]|nr:Lar family restriction alleviation protein [Mogibacterium sp.]
MDIFKEVVLEDCPFCGGAGLLEEEEGWCWYAICVDCGSQTAPIEYRRAEDRESAARKVGQLWNMGKVVRSDLGE